MDASQLAVGVRVRVAFLEEAAFIPMGHYKDAGINSNTGRWLPGPKPFVVARAYPGRRAEFTPPEWIDDQPRPWYPYGEVVEIEAIVDQFFVHVRDGNGRVWRNPIGCWALEIYPAST